jgi:prolyl-tRNA synthetase
VAAARSGFATVPTGVLGPDGEQRLNQQGVSVRCLQRPDGSLPAADDVEPDEELLAVVARAY